MANRFGHLSMFSSQLQYVVRYADLETEAEHTAIIKFEYSLIVTVV